MTHFQRLLLWLRTVRYLAPGQVRHRAFRSVRRRFWRRQDHLRGARRNVRLADGPPIWAGLTSIARDLLGAPAAAAALARAAGAGRGSFTFLNTAIEFPAGQPGWHDAALSQLWRFHLHYFDYTRDLLLWAAAGHRREAYEAFRALARSWIQANRFRAGDGWHPFTISLRAVNWLHAAHGFEPELRGDPEFRSELLTSLRAQLAALTSDLELDVRGNHLLKNLKALVFAGRSLRDTDAARWGDDAMAMLERELAEQILADGGHFERSPGYHVEVLKDILELQVLLTRSGVPVPGWLTAAVLRMLAYLDTILAPDGEVPLLKDTSWHDDPAGVLAAGAIAVNEARFKRSADCGLYASLLFGADDRARFAGWPINGQAVPSTALRTTAHYVVRDDSRGDYLIADLGAPCPDYLPAHAHADLLSYELLVGGQRVIVDSGVYEYAAGGWRDYFRSTRAHNTVEVEGADQSEVWDSFRVARRARPGGVRWESDGERTIAQASHDGYRRLRVPVLHRRTFAVVAGSFWLVIDELFGHGTAAAENHIHLHPGVAPVATSASEWRLEGLRTSLHLSATEGEHVRRTEGQMLPRRQGWYSEQFGIRTPNVVLSLGQDGALPRTMAYVIARDTPAVLHFAEAADRTIVVEHGARRYTLAVPVDGPPGWRS